MTETWKMLASLIGPSAALAARGRLVPRPRVISRAEWEAWMATPAGRAVLFAEAHPSWWLR